MSESQLNGKQIKLFSIPKNRLGFNFDANELVYENPNSVPVNIGGVEAGTIFPSGTTIKEILDQLFYPFIEPTINLNSLPLYEKGALVDPTPNITGTVIFNSETINNIYLKRNSTIIQIFNSPTTPFNLNYVDSTPQNSNVTYNLEVEGLMNFYFGSVTADFVAATYHGVGPANASANDIINFSTKNLFQKADRTLSFTPNLERYYYCYPSSYGILDKIIDQNGFNITADFVKKTVIFSLPDNTPETYYVYEFNADTTQLNFEISFLF